MITITLKDLHKNNLYSRVLQIGEYLCEEFHLSREFGIISMSNQSIVDYLLLQDNEFCIEMNIFIDSDEISISFTSEFSIFTSVAKYTNEKFLCNHEFTLLSDNFSVSSDYKTVNFSFHVKPLLQSARYLPVEILKHKSATI